MHSRPLPTPTPTRPDPCPPRLLPAPLLPRALPIPHHVTNLPHHVTRVRRDFEGSEQLVAQPLLALARTACWVIMTLAHHAEDSDAWICYMQVMHMTCI